MTEQEKQLLIKVLCEMLPYKVMVNVKSRYEDKFEIVELNGYHIFEGSYNIEYRDMKPYLRPMSSMTEEEEKQYQTLTPIVEVVFEDDASRLIDWLKSKYLDYRGLIPMGLALPALEGMYK